MKKFGLGLLAVCAAGILLFGGCAAPAASGTSAPPQVISGGNVPAGGTQIALLATAEQLESEFGQTVWNSISRFAGEQGFAANSYTLDEDPEAAQTTLEIATKGNTGLLVLFGAEMADFARQAARQHSDMHVILLDAPEPLASQPINLTEVRFDAVQAGWLVGWAAVAEGMRSLSYMETEEAQARKYALGFVLGAQAAAEALGVESVRVAPCWVAAEMEEQELQRQAEELAASGVELFFMNVPAQAGSVLRAARGGGARAIGVGYHSAELDATLISSLYKAPKAILQQLLGQWQAGRYNGGESLEGGIAEEAAALVLEGAYFEHFDEESGEAARQAFLEAGGAGTLQERLEEAGGGQDALPAPWALGLERVYFSMPAGQASAGTPSTLSGLGNAPVSGEADSAVSSE